MGFENEFFDWKGWDDIDGYGSVQFRDCTFKRDVPPFKKGDKVDAIFMDFVDSLMCVYEGEKETIFKIGLTITLNREGE